MVEKRVGPKERGGKSAKRSEKRETSRIKMRVPRKEDDRKLDSLHFYVNN